jgi:hypothetical protein
MNEDLVTVIEAKHHNREETAGGVKPESQLACGTVLIQVADEDGARRSWTASSGSTPCLRAES